ncbi:MAG: hypothetical protein ACRC18_06385 [Cetobacterium sp.]
MKYYEYYGSKGLCPRCGHQKLSNEKTLCISCREELSDVAKKHYHNLSIDKKKEKMNYTKRKKQLCTAFGVCTACMKYDSTNGVLCYTCWKKRQDKRLHNKLNKSDIDRSERVQYGKCYLCGEDAVSEYKLCEKHLKPYQDNMKEVRKLANHDNWTNDIYRSKVSKGNA